MNATNPSMRWMPALALVAVVAAPAAWAETEDAMIDTMIVAGPSFAGDAESIQVKVENDKITVTVNGEKIPADRIRREDGQVIILDEDGNELRSVGIFVGEDDPIWWFGEDEEGFQRWRTFVESWHEPAMAAEPPRVMLGAYLAEPDDALRYHLGLEPGSTVLVAGVAEGLPAHAAGLRQHDVIVELGGKSPVTRASITERLAQLDPGNRLDMTVIQQGERKRLTVTLEAYDAERLGGNRMGLDLDLGMRMNVPGLQRRIIGPLDRDAQWDKLRVDPQGRMFVQPRIRVGSEDDAPGEEAQVDRIERLNRRIEELQRALERVLEETGDDR